MNSIAPVWDGNETWLVLGGGGLLAAFPLAYAIILPALYAPLIAMLLGLVFRGVAFEFRWRDPGHRKYWDAGFFLGSAGGDASRRASRSARSSRASGRGPRLCRRLVGLADARSACSPAPASSSAMRCSARCWLIWKTEGPLQERARRHARLARAGFARSRSARSAWRRRSSSSNMPSAGSTDPGLLVTAPMPLLVVGAAFALWRSLGGARDWLPFALTLALFLLSMAGLAVSIWPDVIPGRVTIWQAAAPYSSQLFMLVGAAVLVPLILAYTAWSYWVFRGKVGEAWLSLG